MKKLKKLKLTSLVDNELEKQKMEHLIGGYGCSCQCWNDGSLNADQTSFSYFVNGCPGLCMCSCVNQFYYSQSHNGAKKA